MFIESLDRPVHYFAFRLISSFINSFPISLFQRFNLLIVCVKKSICVEEEKIRLTLFSRMASAYNGVFYFNLNLERKTFNLISNGILGVGRWGNESGSENRKGGGAKKHTQR